MEIFRYYRRIFGLAFTRAPGIAQDILFGVLVVSGVGIYFLKTMGMIANGAPWMAEITGWQIAAIVFGTIFAVRLMLAPYWLFKEQEETIRKLKAGSDDIDALSPPQLRLLGVLTKYLTQFATNKLVISRTDGSLCFDNASTRGRDISLMQDLYGATDQAAQTRFADLVESMPSEYLKSFSEMRWDSPFVVGLTPLGLRRVRENASFLQGSSPLNFSTTPKSQLTTQLFADPQSQAEKSYGAWWGNIVEPMNILYGVFSSKAPDKESVSIFLTNVGPGGVRRVRIKWNIDPTTSIPDLIKASGLMRSSITEIGRDHLNFQIKRPKGINSGGFVFQLSGENEIPIISDGTTQMALLPKPVNTALFLNALCLSRIIAQRNYECDRGTGNITESETAQMPPITLDVRYENQEGSSVEQKFVINGMIRFGNMVPGEGWAVGIKDPEGAVAHISNMSIRPL